MSIFFSFFFFFRFYFIFYLKCIRFVDGYTIFMLSVYELPPLARHVKEAFFVLHVRFRDFRVSEKTWRRRLSADGAC